LNGGNAYRITSTGQSGSARRTVTALLSNKANASAVVLDETACSSVDVSGSADITFPGNVNVNSSCATAMTVSGSAWLRTARVTPRGEIDVFGSNPGYTGTHYDPPPIVNVPRVDDPEADLPIPLSTSPYAAIRAAARNIVTTRTTPWPVPADTVLHAGVYYGGLSISSGNVTMDGGVYILAGGGLDVSGGNLTGCGVSGGPACVPVGGEQTSGVTIFNTCQAYNPATGCASYPTTCGAIPQSAYGSFRLHNNSTVVNITAPQADGDPYQGILLFNDRCYASNQAINIQAVAGSSTLDGLIYSRSGTLKLSGTADVLAAQLIVNQISASGGGRVRVPSREFKFGGGLTGVGWQDY
jgi:hypothetical protein